MLVSGGGFYLGGLYSEFYDISVWMLILWKIVLPIPMYQSYCKPINIVVIDSVMDPRVLCYQGLSCRRSLLLPIKNCKATCAHVGKGGEEYIPCPQKEKCI